MNVLVLCFVFVCIMTFVIDNSYANSNSKIIIDNDAGGDDAMAIFLAILYERHFNGYVESGKCGRWLPKIIGLTTGHGNTNEDNVCRNNQRILKVAKKQDIPIYRGSKTSIAATNDTGDYFGKDGLGDADEDVTGLVEANELGAVAALVELSKTYEGNLTVITLGTLTNVAKAIKLDPDFLNRLSQLYIGAGHIQGEDVPNAEFNAWMDVEAYHIVAKHATPDKVTVLPFSQVKRYLNFTLSWRQDVLGGIETDIIKAQNVYEQVSLKRSDRWQALDPAVVAITLKPDLVEEYKYSKNDIILDGDDRGKNTNDFVEKENANVRIVYSVKTEEFRKFILDVFAHE